MSLGEPRIERSDDPLTAWRKEGERREAEMVAARAQHATASDAERVESWAASWRAWVDERTRAACEGVAVAVREQLDVEYAELAEQLIARDKRIETLELIKLQAVVAKLELRQAEDAVARSKTTTLDLPALPRRGERLN